MSDNLNYIILLSIALCVSCGTTQMHLADAEVSYLEADNSFDDDQTSEDISELIQPYKAQLDAEMNMVIGHLPEDLVKKRPSSNMGNWFCDALVEMARKYEPETVLAIQNYGGLRLPFLGSGPLTKSEVFELMPFDNKLVILDLDYGQFIELLKQISEDGGWPVSRGLELKTTDGKIERLKLNGKDPAPHERFIVAMPDYVANGGGGCHFLKDIPQIDTGMYVREAVIEYCLELQRKSIPLSIDTAKRIQ